MRYRLHTFFVALVVFLQGYALETSSEDHGLFYIRSGVFNVIKHEQAMNFQVEYRSKFALYRNRSIFLRPLLAAAINTQTTTYLGAGVACDLFLIPSIALTPSFAPMLYFKGGGYDLGYLLEFRSSIELSWRNSLGYRFGGMFYHLSNARLSHRNPGSEVLMFFVGVPL